MEIVSEERVLIRPRGGLKMRKDQQRFAGRVFYVLFLKNNGTRGYERMRVSCNYCMEWFFLENKEMRGSWPENKRRILGR